MVSVENLVLVFIAGLITALATGLGALPLIFLNEISDKMHIVLWGIAGGIMAAASLFGLIGEALVVGTPIQVSVGLGIGVLLVVVSDYFIDAHEFDAGDYQEADFKKLVLILGILTVHSFPEGVAIGVSFADLNLNNGLMFLGFTVPILAIFMTVAISIHNIPEGIAISIPLKSMDVSNSRMIWWSIFSSLPQPIGAVIAYYFVQIAREALPIGFGFAAGAMLYLVITEFIPEALEYADEINGSGYKELVAGLGAGFLIMIPLLLV